MENMKKMKTTTQDIWLAAFICQRGIEITGLRLIEGDRKLFEFEDTDEFQLLKRDYYWHRAEVDPIRFKRELRKLKALSIKGEDLMQNQFIDNEKQIFNKHMREL